METKLPRMVDTALPLYVMAFMLGHENEALREIGGAMLKACALSIAEFIAYQKHLETCPRCALRRKLEQLLEGRGSGEKVPSPQEFA